MSSTTLRVANREQSHRASQERERLESTHESPFLPPHHQSLPPPRGRVGWGGDYSSLRPSGHPQPTVIVALVTLFMSTTARASADDKNGWIDLFAAPNFAAFKPIKSDWYYAADVSVDPKDPKKLTGAKADAGPIAINGNGRTANLVTKEKFGDCELSFDFFMPKGSNSGVKFHGVYEIQLYDSFGKKDPLYGGDCGGVYPRSESKPKYHHIDKGIAPKLNASKPRGEWQHMDVIFIVPRFGADGKRTAKANVTVRLNDQIVQNHTELECPTGNNWKNKEVERGPLLIQADHGPVAFRNFRIRHLPPPSGNQ